MTQNGKKSSLRAAARQQLIKPLLARGLSSREIALSVGVTAVTVRRDRQALHKQFLERLEEDDSEFLFELNLSFKELEKLIWQVLENSPEPKLKLKAINTLVNLLSEKVSTFEKLGALNKNAKSSFEDIFLSAFNELQKENAEKEKLEVKKSPILRDENAGFQKTYSFT